eukprot:CAMPEP_0198226626 /NCGR_PEP_ID=MMETSP1445-20131203/105969_1 /TAXON_ID=36898 /ORGANISM="Pyramimonas sp., Strain CCMP2087" /LENGTH=321 /DNA_ID=CAMNT_0043906471 /DNA_START=470 /DNA_END=1435 /DNA_ORIENTATION=-
MRDWNVGLEQTGHLWCCHGPFECQRAPFLRLKEEKGAMQDLGMQPGECACEVGFVGEGCDQSATDAQATVTASTPPSASALRAGSALTARARCASRRAFTATAPPPAPALATETTMVRMCDIFCDEHGLYIGENIPHYTKGLPKREFEKLSRTQCMCLEGWEGKFCEEPVCKEVKCNHGYCVAPEKCQCKRGWSGRECAAVAANGKFFVTEKDVEQQKDRKFKETVSEFKGQQSKLHLMQRESEKRAAKEVPPPWKPAWTSGVGKVQGRGGSAPRVSFEKRGKYAGTLHYPDAAAQMHKSVYGEEEGGEAKVGRGGSRKPK